MREKLTTFFYRLVVVNKDKERRISRSVNSQLFTICFGRPRTRLYCCTRKRELIIPSHPPEILLIGVINGAAPELLLLWYRMPCATLHDYAINVVMHCNNFCTILPWLTPSPENSNCAAVCGLVFLQ